MKIFKGEFGLEAIVMTNPTPDVLSSLQNVQAIELNYSKGWKGDNVSFLSKLPQLISLKIVDRSIASVAPIHCLHSLRRLVVDTYCRTAIDFNEFPQLEKCYIEYRPDLIGLERCQSLTSLAVNKLKPKHWECIVQLKRLEKLILLGASISELVGINSLSNLRSLRLAALRRISTLDPLEGLRQLDHLVVDTCRKVEKIDPISKLANLRAISLDNLDEIESVASISEISTLVAFSFSGSTNVLDGDLESLYIRKMPFVDFRDRPHYSRRCSEFSQKPYMLGIGFD